MQGLVLNPTFSQRVVHYFNSMAYCYDYSAIRTLDCSDYSGSDYYATLGPDSDFDNCFPHTVLAAAIDSD